MIKEYFSDGLLQIAIILSLLRTDLNIFHFPNNELLNYPEVQDILQGQTVGYLPTNFHNHYNTLNSIGGSPHPKHVDSDFYFSSLFRELRHLSRFRRFSGLTTDIEAFLVSESTFGFPPSVQSASAGSTINTNSENGQTVESTDPQVQVQQIDMLLGSANPTGSSSSAVGTVLCDSDSDIAFHSPFPGCDLTKEDLDLIDVLWRQDADLGVGKEVFDPGLRRELERERELELLKEAEKRKEADKQQQDKQRQAHLWLTQNFMRDGETGEWVPLASGDSSAAFSPSGPQTSTFTGPEQDQPVFTLDDALEYVNQHHSENQSYNQFTAHNQEFDTSFTGENGSPAVASFQDQTQQDSQLEDSSLVSQCQNYSVYSHFNQPDQDRLEQNWQELMQLLNGTSFASSTNSTSAANTTSSSVMPPIDTEGLLQQPLTSTVNETDLMQHQQQHFNLNCQPPEHDFCSSVSLSNTSILPQEQNTNGEGSILMGLLNDTGMLLQNATLPVAVNNSTGSMMDQKTLTGDLGFTNTSLDFNSSATCIESLDWEPGEMFLNNMTGLTNLTSMGSSTVLDAGDFPEFLPDEDLDMAINEGLPGIQMLDDAGSDSAVSMGSSSPLQDFSDTLENSTFDGLEGATGGTDYDGQTDSYNRQQGRIHSSSGGSEDDGFHYSCSSYGSPASVHSNCSTNSNDTDHSNSGSSTVMATSHVHHNHTYPTLPGQTPREVKKYAKKDGLSKKGPVSRDQRRAEDLKIPFSFETIVESPVEEFNEVVAKHKLTEQQMTLIRDIRRRGKNKVAAQNCRKRKLDVIYTLENEMSELQRMRDKLLSERRHIEEQTRRAKDVYSSLYQHIFGSLRDEHGQPYNPSQYSLQQSSDGNVFLVPHNYSTTTSMAVSTSPCSSSSTSKGRSTSSSCGFEGKEKNGPQQKKKSKE